MNEDELRQKLEGFKKVSIKEGKLIALDEEHLCISIKDIEKIDDTEKGLYMAGEKFVVHLFKNGGYDLVRIGSKQGIIEVKG